MYTFISPHRFLRQEKTFGICFDDRLEMCLSYFYKIPLEDFFPLTLFNSYYSDQEIIDIIDQSEYGDMDGAAWFSYLTERYSNILSISEKKGERASIIVNNNYLNQIPLKEVVNKLSFPIMASIRLNNYCNSKCLYCFNHSNRSQHSHLSFAEVKNVVEQLHKGGVTTLNITGGDPLCHPDIYQILQLLTFYEFQFNISTKKVLTTVEILALSRTGVRRLQISIDSCDDILNEQLIQKKNYFEKQSKSIRELISNGIEVEVNCVINALNINGIEKLLLELNQLGVKKLTLTPYLSVSTDVDSLLMTTEEQICELCNSLENNKGLAIAYDIAIPEQNVEYSYSNGEHPMCSGGRMSLVINHDGSVTICERLVDIDAFCVGNIKDNRIIDIWYSDKMLKLTHPSSENFCGTSCHSCENYNACITENGACYARISKVSSRVFDCDPFCIRSGKKVRFH